MKSTLIPISIFGSRARGGKLTGVMLCLLMAHAAFAQLYINNNAQYYAEPGPPQFPQIDATAFDNENIFSVTYNTFTFNTFEVCEPWWGTLFYTNNGEMILNAPFSNFGVSNGVFNLETPGVAFEFNLQQTNSNVTNSMAGTFYSPGTIHCDSVLDGNNEETFDGSEFFFQTSIGEAFIQATNIIIPGNIEVGANGLLDLNGQNVDLSRSVLTFEELGVNASNFVNGTILSEGEGYDTNGDWNPFIDLQPTTAFGSLPDLLSLTNSLSYFGLAGGGSNFVSRSVFIQNDNTNTPYTVYITPALYNNEGALIQWTGTYIDSASGQIITNYLYLFHFYIASTNLGPIVEFGTPATAGNDSGFFNFVWSQTTPLAGLPAPTVAGFENIFNDNNLTNIYEFFNAQLDGTTVSTGPTGTNPSGALTNVPNRIDITASHALNLAFSQITGENYIFLMATNEFDGSVGAQINSPFYDINLGNTNGVMTISNLVAQNIPAWGGLLDEWSDRWTNTDVSGIDVDYRVMLLESALTPTITPQIQNLALNATNSLVISDVLNVFNSLYATPASLTLTTNGIGVGANSPEGELNLENANSTTWSWGGSFPNLLWLTNNGGIIIPNFASFIGNSNIVTVIPGSPIMAATNTLSESAPGTSVTQGSTVTIGSQTYTFTTTAISSTTPAYTVEIGNTNDATMTNLIAAINYSAGAGKVYGTYGSFYTNEFASAGPLINHAFTVTALVAGPGGNATPVSTTAAALAWDGSTLSGGANPVSGSTNVTGSAISYGAFISDGLLMDQGSTIWANNFLGSGVVSNGAGSFTLSALTATLTNCSLTAGGAVSITANTLLASNIVLQAGRSLMLDVTNWLWDGGVTNGNVWSVDSSNSTGFDLQGLLLPLLPTNNTPGLNNLLGTTIDLQSPAPNKEVSSTWAGQDYGVSALGYLTNNVAIGQLILDAVGSSSSFYFSGIGVGVTNAIYVDRLILEDFAALTNNFGQTKIGALNINTNFIIYYADALSSGQDVSYIINGFNTNRLVWVPEYTGYFSSTNVVYLNGTTNTLNLGLLEDPNLDSNGNGIANNVDPDPIFVSSQVNFRFAVTNSMGRLSWDSIPSATNAIYYTTNMMPSTWMLVTNFISPSAVPPVGGWPITNVVYETLHGPGHGFYRVVVSPNNADVYGP
jgi:hypothetical protein